MNMALTRVRAIEGKTIATAKQGGGEFEQCDNRTLQLQFTDGTTFCLDVETRQVAEGTLYRNVKGDDGKRLYRQA